MRKYSRLGGGIQPVRVIVRALALRQLAEGKTAPKVASSVCLTAKAIREIGWRYCQQGLDRALYDKPRPGARPVLNERQCQRNRRHGLKRPARDPGSLDGAVDRRGGRAA